MFRFTLRARPGWTCIEVVAAILIVCVLVSVLIAAAPQARREARLAMDLSKLGRIGVYTGNYALDHEDRVWGFSWKAGITPSQYPDLRQAGTDIQASRHQAVDIIRRIGGFVQMPVMDVSWMPYVQFSHLPLVEYLGASLPDATFVSTGDRHRLQWSLDPEGFRRGDYQPCQPSPFSYEHRWPYSAGFELPPAWYDRETDPMLRMIQGGPAYAFIVPNGGRVERAFMADVAFPSQKVLVHDRASWQVGRRPLTFLAPAARVSMLLADGSAEVRATRDSNPGWDPRRPTEMVATSVEYMNFDRCDGPQTANGQERETYPGVYRWTRQGLAGRDFGGPEVR